MKRFLAVVAMLLILCLLTGCSFTTNYSDNVGKTAAESTEKVSQMLQALVDGDMDAAMALMHPEAVAKADNRIPQMSDFLAGRTVAEMNQKGVRVNTSTGTAGKTRQEVTNFQVLLEDGTEIYVAATYYSDNAGEGFVSFQLVLGIV
jgi:hypothetical protein